MCRANTPRVSLSIPTFDRNERLSWYLNSYLVHFIILSSMDMWDKQLSHEWDGKPCWTFPLNNTRNENYYLCCFSSEECISLPPSPMPILASLSSVDFWLQIKLELKTYFLFHMYGVSCLYCVRTNWKSNRQWIDFCTCMEKQRNWNKIFEAKLLIGQILYNNLSIADWRYSVIFGHELYPIYTWFNFHHRIITSVSSDFARSDQYWLDSTSKHTYTCMYTNFLRRQ